MDEFQLAALQEAVRSRLGQGAQFAGYSRKLKTPMRFFLDSAREDVGGDVLVYWVDQGTPEVFCLRTPAATAVAFSRRYVELTGFVRHCLGNQVLSRMRVEVAARTCLKLMAELTLSHGDPDFAVMAFQQSVIGKGVSVPDTDTLLDLEGAPIDEAYMTIWFYGLAHELGHIVAHEAEHERTGLFSDDTMLAGIDAALDMLPARTNSSRWVSQTPGSDDGTRSLASTS